jgi:hypothetical protein
MEITLIKTLRGDFKLAYDSDVERAKKIPLNEPICYLWSKPRNLKFHKKFFGLLNMVFENQEQYTNVDHLRKDLTIEAGFYDVRYDLHGIEVREPKSISFAKMDDNEFSEFYNRVVDVVVKWLGVDKQDVLDNIEQYF